MPDNADKTSSTEDTETAYFYQLTTLRKKIDKLRTNDPLRITVENCMSNLEKIRSNLSDLSPQELSQDKKKFVFIELTEGLSSISKYIEKPFDKNALNNLVEIEKEPVPTMSRIISGLYNAGLKVKSFWDNRTNFQKGLIVLGVLGVIAAAVFLPPILIPVGVVLAHSLGVMAIPALGGVLPGMTVSGLITNVLAGAAFSVINPMAWKYTKGAFEEWRYRAAIKSLETKIATLPDGNPNEMQGQLKLLSSDFLKEVKALKTTGDNSVARAQIVKAVEAWNTMLDKPTMENINHAQQTAIFGGDLPSPTSRIRTIYNKLGYVAVAAALVITAMVPLSAAAHVSWASNFLLANIPIKAFGIASNTGVYSTASGLGIGLGVEHGVMPIMKKVAGHVKQAMQENPLQVPPDTKTDCLIHPLGESARRVVADFTEQANLAEKDALHIKHTAFENMMSSYKKKLHHIEEQAKPNETEEKSKFKSKDEPTNLL